VDVQHITSDPIMMTRNTNAASRESEGKGSECGADGDADGGSDGVVNGEDCGVGETEGEIAGVEYLYTQSQNTLYECEAK
jgi:hypothetical protein